MLIRNRTIGLCKIWVLGFIFLHILAWGLAPALVRCNLAMDAMEGATWGHEMQMGYDKNPFFNAWVTEWAIKIGGQSGWATYFFSQLSVAICFWALFSIAKKIVPPIYALISILLLEGIQYYNFHAIDLSDNTLELSTWSLTILFFYRAIQKDRLRDWLLTSLFAALALMTKYYSLVLFASMVLYLLFNISARQYFKRPYPYLSALFFFVLILPHLIWLYTHDFITVHYLFERIDAPYSRWNHVFFPLKFAWQQFEVVLPALLLCTVLMFGKNIHFKAPFKVTSDHAQFLFFIGAGPFLLTVLLSLITGIPLRAGWGTPLLSFFGLFLMIWWRPFVSLKKLYCFIACVFIFLSINIIIYCTVFLRASDTSSAIFPGREIATELTREWHDHYMKPLRYVAGTRWIAGNVALYSPDRPKVFIDWDLTRSPWINEKKLKKNGALFVWEETAKEKMDWEKIIARYPILTHAEKRTFNWERNPKLPKITIKLAWLPPGPS